MWRIALKKTISRGTATKIWILFLWMNNHDPLRWLDCDWTNESIVREATAKELSCIVVSEYTARRKVVVGACCCGERPVDDVSFCRWQSCTGGIFFESFHALSTRASHSIFKQIKSMLTWPHVCTTWALFFFLHFQQQQQRKAFSTTVLDYDSNS